MSAKVPTSKEPLSRLTLTTQPHLRHHPFFYIGGIFLNAVVFVVAGPPIGGVVLLTVKLTLEHAISGLFSGMFSYFVFFFVTVPTSYLIGFLPAAVTGTIVAIASIWITSNRFLYTIAAIVGGVVSILLLARSEFLMRDSGLVSSFISFAVSGSIAALVCSRLTKPFLLAVLPGPNLPDKLMTKTK